MIKLRHITKSFGNLQVLRGIDLDIQKGEVVSIVGPSGAGKTTLLQIMGTLDKADEGIIEIDGIDVSRLKQKELSKFRNQKIGFVFQFHQLLPEFTALENIMIPASLPERERARHGSVLRNCWLSWDSPTGHRTNPANCQEVRSSVWPWHVP